MKKLEITNVIPKGFVGKINISHKNVPFGEVKIKTQLKENTPIYIYLFKIMKDLFSENPELNIGKFGEIFEAGLAINGKEKTEKQIMDMFGGMFKINLSKLKPKDR